MRVAPHTIHDGIGFLTVLSVWNVLNLILYHTTHIEIQIGRLTYGYIAGAQLGCNDSLSLSGRVINRTCCNVDHEPTDSHQHTEYATPFQSLTELLLTLATFIRSVPTAKE